jgi:hypothetical protein
MLMLEIRRRERITKLGVWPAVSLDGRCA